MRDSNQITYNGITMDVDYDFYPDKPEWSNAGVAIYPAEPAICEVDVISIGGQDVTELIKDSDIERIEEQIIEGKT